jgi:hypothetical protein
MGLANVPVCAHAGADPASHGDRAGKSPASRRRRSRVSRADRSARACARSVPVASKRQFSSFSASDAPQSVSLPISPPRSPRSPLPRLRVRCKAAAVAAAAHHDQLRWHRHSRRDRHVRLVLRPHIVVGKNVTGTVTADITRQAVGRRAAGDPAVAGPRRHRRSERHHHGGQLQRAGANQALEPVITQIVNVNYAKAPASCPRCVRCSPVTAPT